MFEQYHSIWTIFNVGGTIAETVKAMCRNGYSGFWNRLFLVLYHFENQGGTVSNRCNISILIYLYHVPPKIKLYTYTCVLYNIDIYIAHVRIRVIKVLKKVVPWYSVAKIGRAVTKRPHSHAQGGLFECHRLRISIPPKVARSWYSGTNPSCRVLISVRSCRFIMFMFRFIFVLFVLL